jgi:FixJ family two-component response regulator
MTGSSDEIIRRQAMEIGCVAFLHKPLPEDQLIESIVEAMTSNSDFD